MKARVQLNAPVWASYEQKQHEPIIRCGRLQGRVQVTQTQPLCEILCFNGKVQGKHAPGQLVSCSPPSNLITVMSLETAGCTASDVDTDTQSYWQLNARHIVRLKANIRRWLIDHRKC